MSAAENALILHDAASLIRHDIEFQQQHGDPAFLTAVAAYLDACALVVEVAPDRQKVLALNIARAYLGEDA